MLSQAAETRLTQIGKAFDEDEARCILKTIKARFLVEELDRRNKIVYEQYNSLVYKIDQVKDGIAYEELLKILNECRDVLRGEVNE